MLDLTTVTPTPVPSNDLTGIIITGIFGLIIAAISAILARRGQKLGNKENRAPNVQEMWAQQDFDRRQRQVMEDMWWDLRAAFKSYFRRVSGLVLTLGITHTGFGLTASEKKAIDATPPEDEDPVPTETGK